LGTSARGSRAFGELGIYVLDIECAPIGLQNRSDEATGGLLRRTGGRLSTTTPGPSIDIPSPKTARSPLARISAVSITNTGGKGSPREGREELRGHCALIASPQFLMPVRAGNAAAFRLRRDERVGARTRWFLSDPSSSPARARIQRLRPLLSDNDVHIRLSGWFRSEFKTGRNYCAAQVYAGTKNAVGTISEGLRQEPGDKLRVTCISPGFVNTDFADSMTNPEIRQQTMATRDQIAIGRSHLRSSNRLMWM